jgi:hypothetical protein
MTDAGAEHAAAANRFAGRIRCPQVTVKLRDRPRSLTVYYTPVPLTLVAAQPTRRSGR